MVRVPTAHTLGDMLRQPAHRAQIRHQMHPGDDLAQVPATGACNASKPIVCSSHGPL